MKNKILTYSIGIIGLVLINFLASKFFFRLDVTEDQRFTLSDATEELVKGIQEPIHIDILLKGNFPPEFKRLQLETKHLLEEFESLNNLISFSFVNPLKDEPNPEQLINSMQSFGLVPANVTIQENGKTSNETIFPWGLANLNQKSVRIPLLNNSLNTSEIERINSSVQQLEYEFANALKKLTAEKTKSLAVLKGNGELLDKHLRSYLQEVSQYYRIGAFQMDSLSNQPQKVLENLKRFDAILVAQPTEPFTDNEKYLIDQYIMDGGKSMWLMDAVAIDLDSLSNNTFSNVTFPRDLNLNDLFFKYGVRINPNLIKDTNHTPAVVIDRNNQPKPIKWYYSPIVKTNNVHPISKNLNSVKLEFANQIDTLKNGVDKTILLKSSPRSTVVGSPAPIQLFEFENPKIPQTFDNGNQNIGVLLEGTFTSGFKNRIKPIPLKGSLDESTDNKMIVIADGDVLKYDSSNKEPLVNGIDPWTQQIYGNKDFLINSLHYLMDDTGLINVRAKEVQIAFLNKEKVANEKVKWQLINILFPLVLLAIFGYLNHYIRKRKYA